MIYMHATLRGGLVTMAVSGSVMYLVPWACQGLIYWGSRSLDLPVLCDSVLVIAPCLSYMHLKACLCDTRTPLQIASDLAIHST